MKLTEDNVYFDRDVCDIDKSIVGRLCINYGFSGVEDYIHLKKQILSNQEIVEKIKALPFPVTHQENQSFIKQLMFIMNTTKEEKSQ